jgi:hypothetical protein
MNIILEKSKCEFISSKIFNILTTKNKVDYLKRTKYCKTQKETNYLFENYQHK